MYNLPTGVLPNMDDMVVIEEWFMGMPYLPMHTAEWAKEYPHPNMVDGWYLWCDLETKATYIIQTANPKEEGMNIHMGGGVVVEMKYKNMETVAITEEDYYGEYEEYDPECNDNIVPVPDDEIDPWEAQTKYKVGYMWDATGKGYMLGNKYHTHGWWCLDDCLWDNMLWDFKDEYTLMTDAEKYAKWDTNIKLAAKGMKCEPEDLDEQLGQLGLQMGGTNKGVDATHLENCLGM